MNCSEIQNFLSSYHDGQLVPDQRTAVEQHLETCPDCSRLLAEFGMLSDMAECMTDPQPPDGLWSAIERVLDEQQVVTEPDPVRRRSLSNRMYAIAAAAAVVVACVSIWLSFPHDDGHSQMAVNFNQFLEQFPSDPAAAQQVLLASYDHEAVDLDEAARQVRYQPVATERLPNGYSLDKVYVMQMPCCTCVQCLYKGENDESLVLFEHHADQPMWFGKRPAITCPCKGRETKIVPFNGQLAASWSAGKRRLTVIGVRDMEHVVALIDHFSKSAAD